MLHASELSYGYSSGVTRDRSRSTMSAYRRTRIAHRTARPERLRQDDAAEAAGAACSQPAHGHVSLDGRRWLADSRRDIARHIAVVPQETHPAFDYTVHRDGADGPPSASRPSSSKGLSDLAHRARGAGRDRHRAPRRARLHDAQRRRETARRHRQRARAVAATCCCSTSRRPRSISATSSRLPRCCGGSIATAA